VRLVERLDNRSSIFNSENIANASFYKFLYDRAPRAFAAPSPRVLTFDIAGLRMRDYRLPEALASIYRRAPKKEAQHYPRKFESSTRMSSPSLAIEPMKVGLLHARTGPAGLWAPSLDASALLAVAEINVGGGIRGEEIEIIVGDCGCTVAEAIEAVDTLLDVEGAEVIIGGHPSNLRDAVSHRLAGKTPYIYTPQYEGTACGPSTVAIGSTDQELLRPGLHWLRDRKQAERFFFVGDDYIWPRMAFESARRLVREQGGRWAGECFLANRSIEHAEVLRRIARSGAQVVIQALVGQSAIDFNRAFAAAGLDQKMLRFGLIVDETVICGIGAAASLNLFTAAHYFAGRRSRTNDRFLERYHEAFGEWAPTVSAASVYFYEGLHVLAGLARELETRKAEHLARYLNDPNSRLAARGLLGDKPVGQSPSVFLAQADGVRLEVIAEFAA
jgi:urea transport system substrate-binding protein